MEPSEGELEAHHENDKVDNDVEVGLLLDLTSLRWSFTLVEHNLGIRLETFHIASASHSVERKGGKPDVPQ